MRKLYSNISIRIMKLFGHNIKWCNVFIINLLIVVLNNKPKIKKKRCKTSDAGLGLDLNKAQSWLSTHINIMLKQLAWVWIRASQNLFWVLNQKSRLGC